MNWLLNLSYLSNNWWIHRYLYDVWFLYIMNKLKNIKGSSKEYNISITNRHKIAQNRNMNLVNIWSNPTNSCPKWDKFDSILIQSLVLQFKEEEEDENLESLMSKLKIQDWVSSKQHDQNDEALIVADCNDAVTNKEKE